MFNVSVGCLELDISVVLRVETHTKLISLQKIRGIRFRKYPTIYTFCLLTKELKTLPGYQKYFVRYNLRVRIAIKCPVQMIMSLPRDKVF